jgi:hypothetical protein
MAPTLQMLAQMLYLFEPLLHWSKPMLEMLMELQQINQPM